NISQNNIHKIEDGAFIHTSHLEFLNLSVNQLQFLSSSMFDGLMNLTYHLLLARNKIYRINPSAFANLENLKVIDLSSNKLYTLNAMHAVFNMGSLRELHIKDNAICRFLSLDITGLVKKTFRADFFQGASSLADLDLFNNYISYESSKMLANPPFKFLRSLKKLAINSQGGNGLKYFPANFLDGLESIPETFTLTPTFQELDLSNNKLSSLNNSLFHSISKLKQLHLNRNGLKSLNFFLNANLSRLTLFRATENDIDVITEEQFQHFTFPSFPRSQAKQFHLYM
uniref:Chaoptin n=1 Tax=Laticauda laticaudata TaxID=8630 RepID=A0A8C5WP81_LATLA